MQSNLTQTNKNQNKLTTPSEWLKFSKQLNIAKQTVQQLSKLYIIIHQKVKNLIKRSITSPNSNFSSDAVPFIKLIGQVLQKINQAQNDQYLIQIEKNMLKKYEKSLLNLLYQIQMMLKIQQSKTNINVNELKSIKNQKRHQFDLQDQVLKSKKRMIRSKSGKRVQNKQQKINKQEYQQMQINQVGQQNIFPTQFKRQDNNIPLMQSKIDNRKQQYLIKLHQKHSQVNQIIMNTITKNGFNLSFEKKYQQNNLQNYLKQRKQMTALMFNEQLYDQILLAHKNINNNEGQLSSNIKKGGNIIKLQNKLKDVENKRLINDKLFPEFQIKTKFIKPQIKTNILKTIMQVKQALLNQYHLQNIKVLQNAKQKTRQMEIAEDNVSNRNGLIVKNKKSGVFLKNNLTARSKSVSNIQSKLTTAKNITQNNINMNNNLPFRSQLIHSHSNNSKLQNKTSNIPLTLMRKRSLVNENSKPYYDTQYWNEQRRQRYHKQFVNRFKDAKISLDNNM